MLDPFGIVKPILGQYYLSIAKSLAEPAALFLYVVTFRSITNLAVINAHRECVNSYRSFSTNEDLAGFFAVTHRTVDNWIATHPDFAYVPHAAPQALHNAGRLKWGSGPRGGVPAYTGEDVIIVRDEKIAALYVFLDSPPA